MVTVHKWDGEVTAIFEVRTAKVGPNVGGRGVRVVVCTKDDDYFRFFDNEIQKVYFGSELVFESKRARQTSFGVL